MIVGSPSRLLVRVGLLLLLQWPIHASGGEEFVVTGDHWLASDENSKKSFLVGAATIVELEQEFQGPNPPSDSMIPTLVSGLSELRLQDLKSALDRYYADHPELSHRPVMHVIWDLALVNIERRREEQR